MRVHKLTIFIFIMIIILFSSATLAQVIQTDYQLDASLVNQFPDPARAGNIVEIRINLENVGLKMVTDAIAELQPKFPFSLVTGEEAVRAIETLPSYPDEAASRILLYRVLVHPDAPEGQHDLKFRYSLDGGNMWIVEKFKIDVTTKEFAQIIYIDKTRITPGKETELIFTVNNIGNAPLTNMVFSWTEEEDVVLPVSTDNTRYIKFLDASDSIDLKYTVIANPTAERGLYSLDLKLVFDTKNETGQATKEEINTKAGILVGGGTDFDIAFSESSGGEIALSIANIGENDATSVKISIPEQESFVVQGGSSVIIGNLNTGDFTIATFRIISSSVDRQTTDDLTVEVFYTDSFGDRHTLQKSIPLQISLGVGDETATRGRPTGGSGSLVNNIIIVVIIIIIAFVLYKRHKKGKSLLPFFGKKG